MAPKPPNVRSAPAEPWRSSGFHGGLDMAPQPPNVRSAPAEPWRSSGFHGGLDMAPQPPNVRSAPAERGARLVFMGASTWPPTPQTFGAPRRSVALVWFPWGPRHGPQPPKRSERPGGAWRSSGF